MPSAAFARLESLLGARKLDHTLASHRLAATEPVVSSPPWEFPRGQISEIVGSRSSGRQTLLVAWLAAATERGELTALVDPLDMFDPVSAAGQGVDLTRFLWVRGRALGPDAISLPREIGELREQLERAVKALNLILQAGGFGLVAVDLAEMPVRVVNSLPFTTWRRLHRVIEGGDTAGVVIANEPVARSVGGITLKLDHRLDREHTESPAVAEEFIFKNSAPAASLPNAALKTRHVRLLSDLTISGTALHGRGMRTSRVEFVPSGGLCVQLATHNPGVTRHSQPVTRN